LDKNASYRTIIKRILRGASPDISNFLTGAVIPDFQALLKLGKVIEDNLGRKEFIQKRSEKYEKGTHESRDWSDSKKENNFHKKSSANSKIKCFNCQKMGHYASSCNEKKSEPAKVKKVTMAQVETKETDIPKSSESLNSKTGGSSQ